MHLACFKVSQLTRLLSIPEGFLLPLQPLQQPACGQLEALDDRSELFVLLRPGPPDGAGQQRATHNQDKARHAATRGRLGRDKAASAKRSREDPEESAVQLWHIMALWSMVQR